MKLQPCSPSPLGPPAPTPSSPVPGRHLSFLAVGTVAGQYYSILVDGRRGAFLRVTVWSALLYAACAALSSLGTLLERRLALAWRSRLTTRLQAAYCADARFHCLHTDNPDQRMAQDVRTLADDAAGIARVAVSVPFRMTLFSVKTAHFLGWRGLAVVGGFVVCAVLIQW